MNLFKKKAEPKLTQEEMLQQGSKYEEKIEEIRKHEEREETEIDMLKTYCIYDKRARTKIYPMLAPNTATAIRRVKTELLREAPEGKNNYFLENIKDFTLVELHFTHMQEKLTLTEIDEQDNG